MMMSPGTIREDRDRGLPFSRWGNKASMKSSTAGPALTSNMTRRGRFRREHNSSMEWAPTMDFPGNQRLSLGDWDLWLHFP
jgi:hypothetical protein